MKRIEFGELRISDKSRELLMDVCDTNWASAGPKVETFEYQWGKLFDYKHNAAVSSGTDACINMCLAVRSYEQDMGRFQHGKSEIIVPALCFIATANAVRAAGFKPVFVDVEKETLNIDPNKIDAAITDNTVAIMPVHTMGKPCDMDTISIIAEGSNLFVLEDCCEAHGAKHRGKIVGHWGHMTAFSFYIAHLVCCGEGGMVSTNDEDLYTRVLATRSHGRQGGGKYFDHPYMGLNSKMNDLEASIGLGEIDNFQWTWAMRKLHIKMMRLACDGFEDLAWFSEEDEEDDNCPHGFSMTFKEKGDVEIMKDVLEKNNIHWKRNFGCIPTQHEAFADMGYEKGAFPNAEWIGDNGIHIGCHQWLTLEDIHQIQAALRKGFNICKM